MTTSRIIQSLAFTLLVLCTALPCSAADLVLGDKVNIIGNIATTGCIEWGDGSIQCNASAQDISAVWGNINGLMANQTDLWNALEAKEDKASKGITGGYAPLDAAGKVPIVHLPDNLGNRYNLTEFRLHASDFQPTWFDQGNLWQPFEPTFALTFIKDFETTKVRVSWADNVGTAGNKWCNIGLFLDDEVKPICSGSWSGVAQNYQFAQQTISCVIDLLPGQHILTVKHRSEFCMYGNYAWDDDSLIRRLTVEEF